MGDRTYARFSIPTSVISTPERRRTVANLFSLGQDEITALLSGPPQSEPADYVTNTALRQVGGAPSLVIEDEQWDYGGSSEMQALVAAHIPFLQCNATGGDYGSTATAYSGRGAPMLVYVNPVRENEIFAPVTLKGRRALVQACWLRNAERYARIKMRLVGC